jgi:hypothetical protein
MGLEKRYEYDEVTLLSPLRWVCPEANFLPGNGEKNNWLRIWLEKNIFKPWS